MRPLALMVVLMLTGACDSGAAVPALSSPVASASRTASASSGLAGAQPSATAPLATRESDTSAGTPTGPIVSATAAPTGTVQPPFASVSAVAIGVPLPLLTTPTAAQWVQLDKMDFPRDLHRTTLYDMHSDVLRQLRREDEEFTFIAPPPPGVQVTLAVGNDSTVLVDLQTRDVVEVLPFPIRLDPRPALGETDVWRGRRVRLKLDGESVYGALRLPRGAYELDVFARTLTPTSFEGDRVIRRFPLGGTFDEETVLAGARWLEFTGRDVSLAAASGDSKLLLSQVAWFQMGLDGLHGMFQESGRDQLMWIDLRTGNTATLADSRTWRGPIRSPRGGHVALTLLDGQVVIWDVSPAEGHPPREVARYAPSTVYFSGWAEDDSAAIVTFYSRVVDTRSRIEIIDLATGAAVPFAVRESERFLGSNASLSGTGRFVLDQGIGAAGIRVFDRETGERVQTPQLRASGMASFSLDDRWIFIDPISGHD
jgi:hypothetical protein